MARQPGMTAEGGQTLKGRMGGVAKGRLTFGELELKGHLGGRNSTFGLGALLPFVLALSTDKIGLLFPPFLLARHNGKVVRSGLHLLDFLSWFRVPMSHVVTNRSKECAVSKRE